MKVEIHDKHERWAVDDVEPNPWNPNVQSAFMREREMRSIREMGMVKAITVRTGDGKRIFKKGKRKVAQIIDGEHRWLACKELGLTEIPVNNLGSIPDKKAKVLTELLNGIHGEPDPEKLSVYMSELVAEWPEVRELLPYTSNEIDDILKRVSFDWGALSPADDGEEDEFDPTTGEKVRRLGVKFSSSQYEIVRKAIELAKTRAETKSDARALELICADYMAGAS